MAVLLVAYRPGVGLLMRQTKGILPPKLGERRGFGTLRRKQCRRMMDNRQARLHQQRNDAEPSGPAMTAMPRSFQHFVSRTPAALAAYIFMPPIECS